MKVAIVAGTPVDVEFGINYFQKNNSHMELLGVPISKNPIDQTIFQNQSSDIIYEYILNKFLELKQNGVSTIVIYCNSLSSTLDIKKLENKTKLNIITPLDAYVQMAKKYNKIGLLSANSISLHNVTTLINSINEKAMICGYASLNIVIDIESKKNASMILEENGIVEIINSFHKSNVDKIILGCTHYDYLENEMRKYSDRIYTPSEYMKDKIIKIKR